MSSSLQTALFFHPYTVCLSTEDILLSEDHQLVSLMDHAGYGAGHSFESTTLVAYIPGMVPPKLAHNIWRKKPQMSIDGW